MTRGESHAARRRWVVTLLTLALLLVARAGQAQMQFNDTIPSMRYFGTFNSLNDGDYRDSLANYLEEHRCEIKTVICLLLYSFCY